jgi:sigma-B regulation protein RsbQ
MVSKRNYVTVLGHGERVLMFGHGFGCDQSMWRAVTPAFEHDYKIVLFDYVGAGGSDAAAFSPVRYGSLRGYAHDVLEICAELGLQRVTFVGHSVSGMIGALAAIMEPEMFANLVMIAPSACYVNEEGYEGGFEREDIDALLNMMNDNFEGWSTMMAPVVAANPEQPEVAAEFAASLARADVSIAQHFARVTFLSDYRCELLKLKTRTLVLQTEDDVMARVNAGEYIQRVVSNCRFEMLNARGHLPHLSAPTMVVKSIKRFLTACK